MRQIGAVGIAAPGEVDPIGPHAACDLAITSREDARPRHAFRTEDELKLPPVPALPPIARPVCIEITPVAFDPRGMTTTPFSVTSFTTTNEKR